MLCLVQVFIFLHEINCILGLENVEQRPVEVEVELDQNISEFLFFDMVDVVDDGLFWSEALSYGEQTFN